MYLESPPLSVHHAAMSSHPAWVRHHRCAANFRFDAGSLCLYSLAVNLPNDAARLMLVWVKTFIAPRDVNLIALLATFESSFSATPWQVDWSTISLKDFVEWSQSWSLDRAYPVMRMQAVQALNRQLRMLPSPADTVAFFKKNPLEQKPILACAWWTMSQRGMWSECLTALVKPESDPRFVLMEQLLVSQNFYAMLLARDLHLVIPSVMLSLPNQCFEIGGGARDIFHAFCGDEKTSSITDKCSKFLSSLQSQLNPQLFADVFPHGLSIWDLEHFFCEFRRYLEATAAIDRGLSPARIRDIIQIASRRALRLSRMLSCSELLHLDPQRLQVVVEADLPTCRLSETLVVLECTMIAGCWVYPCRHLPQVLGSQCRNTALGIEQCMFTLGDLIVVTL